MFLAMLHNDVGASVLLALGSLNHEKRGIIDSIEIKMMLVFVSIVSHTHVFENRGNQFW